jgi:hypothetical protein
MLQTIMAHKRMYWQDATSFQDSVHSAPGLRTTREHMTRKTSERIMLQKGHSAHADVGCVVPGSGTLDAFTLTAAAA